MAHGQLEESKISLFPIISGYILFDLLFFIILYLKMM